MNTLYKVIKGKAEIKGFWKDEHGKIYIDSIVKVNGTAENIKEAFLSGELAVFVSNGKEAVIIDKEGKKTPLKHCIRWTEKPLRAGLVKELLKLHGGLTIYRENGGFTLEIWK